MRLAAQMRGGFYPAPPDAVSYAATFLCPPVGHEFSILDPCAGEGAAILQLADMLGCSPESTYAIELDDSRAEKLRTALPKSNILAPASFFGCRASLNRFSFIWLNPPFDSGYGGHRMEDQFLLTATDWLMPGGVMALVCPEDVIGEYSDVRRHFARQYEKCQIVPFPAKHRPFNEVIVFGHKRTRLRADERLPSWESVQAPPGFKYHIPSGPGPKTFVKAEPTESELQQLLARSPLRLHLTAPPATSLPSPPLALGIGHVALLLASGHLDGIVHPDGKPPHVVRGTSRKREYVAAVTETENADGSSTKKTTLAERIELVVRTVDLTGQIRTFMDTEAKE
jgi:predicted RNA methylase